MCGCARSAKGRDSAKCFARLLSSAPRAGRGMHVGNPADLSAADLARQMRQPKPRVEKALERYRKKYPDCYIENESPRKTDPRYLYRVGDVVPYLQNLAAKKRRNV